MRRNRLCYNSRSYKICWRSLGLFPRDDGHVLLQMQDNTHYKQENFSAIVDMCWLMVTARCRNVVRVYGLGFKQGSDGHDASPEAMFICQELCPGGSLRSLVIKQMYKPTKVTAPTSVSDWRD